MDAHSQNSHHILPLKTYLGVAGVLMVFTVITIAISFVDLGGWNAVVAVFVAAIKATLVAMYFMHLKYDKKINLIIFLTAILFLAIFLSLTFFDVISRGYIYDEVERPIKDNAAMYDKVEADTTTSIPEIIDSVNIDEDTPQP